MLFRLSLLVGDIFQRMKVYFRLTGFFSDIFSGRKLSFSDTVALLDRTSQRNNFVGLVPKLSSSKEFVLIFCNKRFAAEAKRLMIVFGLLTFGFKFDHI